jgi:hypothetical protein
VVPNTLFPSSLDGTPRNVKLFYGDTERKICSGDIITLTTDDPDEKPSPSLVLLEMQWFLHRVPTLGGAAEPRERFLTIARTAKPTPILCEIRPKTMIQSGSNTGNVENG